MENITKTKTNGGRSTLPTSQTARNWDIFPSVFENFLERNIPGFFSPSNWGNIPAVNIRESNDDFMVEVAAPGMKKEDFKVRLDNSNLEISCEKTTERAQTDENYTRREFDHSSFCRYFTLPETVNPEKINAAYEDGILKLVIPKKEESKRRPPKEIKIS